MSGTFADVLVMKPWHTNGVAKSSQCELESYAMAYHQQASSMYMVVQIAEVIMIPEILSLRQIGRFSVVSGVKHWEPAYRHERSGVLRTRVRHTLRLWTLLNFVCFFLSKS